MLPPSCHIYQHRKICRGSPERAGWSRRTSGGVGPTTVDGSSNGTTSTVRSKCTIGAATTSVNLIRRPASAARVRTLAALAGRRIKFTEVVAAPIVHFDRTVLVVPFEDPSTVVGPTPPLVLRLHPARSGEPRQIFRCWYIWHDGGSIVVLAIASREHGRT